MTLAWLHDLDPVVVRLGGSFAIYWYGISYILGFVLAYLVLRWLRTRGATPLDAPALGDMVVWGGLGGVIGGRVGYVLLYRPDLLADVSSSVPFWGAINITKGGMASHGGFLGAMLGFLLLQRSLAKRARLDDRPELAVPRTHLFDLAAFAAPIGLLCGRLANFVNGELLGRVAAPFGTPAPWWAVKYPQEVTARWDELSDDQRIAAAEAVGMSPLELRVEGGWDRFGQAWRALVAQMRDGDPAARNLLEASLNARHPSQLYQALAEGVVVLAVLAIVWARPRASGVISCWFVITYGVGRVATEFFRLPDAHFQNQTPLGLSRGQWLSVALIAIGVAGLALIKARGRPDAPRFGGWLSKRGAKGSRIAAAAEVANGDRQSAADTDQS
ncbi:MAG: prolipoprotein diacylglyceryl transferase [Planctomycetota bacterium]